MSHDLILLYKGFDHETQLKSAKRILSELPHSAIEVPDSGFDIGAYLRAAPMLDQEYVCFMNTFSEIEVEGWLEKLYAQASQPTVGLVGAMGSFESLRESSCLIHKVLWLCNQAAIPYDEQVATYYSHITTDNCVVWSANGKSWLRAPWEMIRYTPRQIYHRLKGLASPIDVLRRMAGVDSAEDQFERNWQQRISPSGDLADYAQFQPFPNPHIRSNGFMVKRSRMLTFAPEEIRTKLDACAFESGPQSLTSRVRSDGLEALVVGSDGKGYAVQDWWQSETFRLGNQENLLLSDNQSRQFGAMAPGAKVTHRRITWGDYLGQAPADFPHLGFSYPINEAITGRRQPDLAATRDQRSQHS